MNGQELENMNRRIGGRKARDNGAMFEQAIETACEYYFNENRARIKKTPEPFKVERSIGQGKFIGHFEEKAQVDFKGTLTGGRSVVFEAKHTEDDKIEQRRVSGEQLKDIMTHHRCGALAFVIVSFRMEAFYRIPAQVWYDMQTIYGHKHLKEKEIQAYKIPGNVFNIKFLDQEEKKL